MDIDITPQLVFTITISIFGLFGNTALIYTYSKKNLEIRFNALMITLAAYDIFYLITDSTTLITNHWTLNHFRGFAFTGSIITTVTISLERYLVLCKDSHILDKKLTIPWHIVLITATSILINLTLLGVYLFVTWTIILSTILLVLNLRLYQKLKILKQSLVTTNKSNKNLKKSMFRAKLCFCFTIMFIICSFVAWLPMAYLVSISFINSLGCNFI